VKFTLPLDVTGGPVYAAGIEDVDDAEVEKLEVEEGVDVEEDDVDVDIEELELELEVEEVAEEVEVEEVEELEEGETVDDEEIDETELDVLGELLETEELLLTAFETVPFMI
jgi:hypothetical protein